MPKKISQDRLEKLMNEIQMSEAFNEEELQPIIDENIRRYTNQFIPNIGRNWSVIINEFYPIVQFNLPNTFLNTPRAFLKPKNKFYITKERDPISGQKVEVQKESQKSANTQEAIINYRLSEMEYKQEVKKCVIDSLLFPHAILWHGYKGNFGMTNENEMFIRDEKTFVKHLFPLEFIKDPTVSFEEVETGMWVGRIIDIPYDDFIEMKDVLDIEKSTIKTFKGYGNEIGTNSQLSAASKGEDRQKLGKYRKPLLQYASEDFQNSDKCDYVRTYEVFLRPTRKERREGIPGKILLLTHSQKKPLRESDWTIKAEGFPSLVLQFNPIPGSLLAMSDIDTYKAAVDQKNAIFNLQLRNAQENSKVWVAIATGEGFDGEEDIEKIKVGDQTILCFKSDTVNGKMTMASPSGMASSELYIIDTRVQRNIENLSGVSDLRKGFLQSGEESATSVQIRNAGSSARPAYRQDIMADFLKASVKYLLQLEKQYTTPKEAVRIVGTLDVQWSDKPTKEDIQADVDVDIDVVSMLPEDPERELRNLRETLILFSQAIQSPAIMAKIQQEGKTINISPLIEQILMRMKIKNPDIYRNIEPQESEGYASIQQMREAQQNVLSTVSQGQIAIPPQEGDDHRVKIEIYSMFSQLIQAMGQKAEVLEQLIMLQQSMLEQEMAKEGKAESPLKQQDNIQNV